MAEGPLALVGGHPFHDGCTFDRELVSASGGTEVVLLPTGAAYEQPGHYAQRAAAHFAAFDAKVRVLDVLSRPDALDHDLAAAVREARFVYLVGQSPMHARSVLKDSPVLDALVAAWRGGAVLAASSGGAMVLCDPMVDPRGGAYTVGLGVVDTVTVVAHHDHWSEDQARRTIEMAPAGLPIVGIDEQTALIRADGRWRVEGVGSVAVFVDGEERDVGALPA